MTEIIKETVTTGENYADRVLETPVENRATSYQTVGHLVYFLFGALVILLIFRLVLKLAGASLASGFVGFIYALSGIFIMPFEGIFRRGFTEGIETTSVFEPATLVAIIVYAVLAWGIVKLISILSGDRRRTV